LLYQQAIVMEKRMNKDELKVQYAQYTSEHLLQLRARGEGLVNEAHVAIEEIMAERGESVAPRPKLAVSSQTHSPARGQKTQNLVIGMFFMFASAFIMQVLKEERLIGAIIGLAIAAFFFIRWMKEASLAPEALSKKRNFERIGEDGFSELMFYAGEGDLDRVRDLLNYGAVINAQDDRGGTALMYASRNGHIEIVRLLLGLGADTALKTKKGLSAVDAAKHSGHVSVEKLLVNQGPCAD
jgi:hypothetical protein